jgi:hypothetical protein
MGAIVALIAVNLGLLSWIYLLNSDMKLLKADVNVCKAEKETLAQALAIQSTLIEANRAEYQTNLATASVTKEVIKTEYKTKIQIIEKWRENNATCPDAINHLNSYHF